MGCRRIVVDQSIGCVPPIFTGPRQVIPVVSYHLKYQSGLETSSSAASLSRSPTWYIASRLTSGSTTVMPSPSAGPIGTRKGASVFHFLRKRDTSDALCRVQPRAARLSPAGRPSPSASFHSSTSTSQRGIRCDRALLTRIHYYSPSDDAATGLAPGGVDITSFLHRF